MAGRMDIGRMPLAEMADALARGEVSEDELRRELERRHAERHGERRGYVRDGRAAASGERDEVSDDDDRWGGE